MEIRVDDKNIEKALRLLKRKMQHDGLFRELKNRRFYEKPSLKKKRKRREAQKRRQKNLRMSRQHPA
ncbi:MAG TPA: 30S ribosomal protein S21 [Nitrospirota bacterium]|nr:30S ribosomal protein S21 [Nitrospirota bacterium]